PADRLRRHRPRRRAAGGAAGRHRDGVRRGAALHRARAAQEAGRAVTAVVREAAPASAVAHDRRRRHARALRVSLVLAALVLVVSAVSLTLGDAGVAPSDVLAALVGRADRLTSFVILDLRLPRLLAAVLVGACLGLSGALFQSVARNPLASPDVIGITAGASATGSI